MTPEQIQEDGRRSYELAIRAARRKLLEPTEEKLWAAIRELRECRVGVLHSEGEGIAALWNVGGLKRIGYFEVLRQAKRCSLPSRADEDKGHVKAWPGMAKDAFK